MGLASPQVRVHVGEALTFVRALDFARMEASVNVVIKLNVESKRTDERVRGMAFLPHGRGKTVRVAVFARGALADEATDAGADLVGAEDLIEQVLQGNIDFDRCLATPDMLPALAKAARILGPRGLMPNPKRGAPACQQSATPRGPSGPGRGGGAGRDGAGQGRTGQGQGQGRLRGRARPRAVPPRRWRGGRRYRRCGTAGQGGRGGVQGEQGGPSARRGGQGATPCHALGCTAPHAAPQSNAMQRMHGTAPWNALHCTCPLSAPCDVVRSIAVA